MMWAAGLLASISSITYPAISAFVSMHSDADKQGLFIFVLFTRNLLIQITFTFVLNIYVIGVTKVLVLHVFRLDLLFGHSGQVPKAQQF